jgi:hypothetical protein
MTWSEYKNTIKPTIKDYQNNQINIFYSGLSSEIGELMSCDFQDFKSEKVDNTNRQMEIGDVLWYIAALELYYKLPDTVNASILNYDIKIENGDQLKWVAASDLFICMGELIEAMHTVDLTEIQYNLNKLFGSVIDYSLAYNVSIVDCLKASLIKLDLRKTGKKSHNKEYDSVKKAINNANKDELLLEPNITKNEYVSLNVKFKDEIVNFNNGDIIVDFFKAMGYIDTNINSSFTMNYGPKFRKLLKDNPSISSGFIVQDKLMKASDLIKNKTSKGSNTIVSQSLRPSIFKTEMTTLNELLDYINENQKQNA